MFRKLAIVAGLSAGSLAFVPAASAQSVTLSIGSGGYYNGDGYANPYSGYGYPYAMPQNYGYYPSYGYNNYGYGYDYRAYERAQRRRAEQLERWQRERARQAYWRHEQWENRDRDDD